MTRASAHAVISIAALAFTLAASAQTAPGLAQAQERYERTLAACNSGNLPAPTRDACVRDAGIALDRARGGPATDVTVPTADGRAVVVNPAGAPVPSGGTSEITSRDGRATIILPADAPTR